MEPLPAVVQAATVAQLPIDVLAAPIDRTGLIPGDSVTALVDHIDGGQTRQWLVQITAQTLKENERTLQSPELQLYTSTGREICFAGDVAALAIRVLGPYRAGSQGAKKARDRWSGTLVNAQFLALGLDRASAAARRIAAMSQTVDQPALGFGVNTEPFPEATTAANRKIADTIGLTTEDERALAGILPALQAFFTIIGHTSGLDDILFNVLDIPWWSIIRHGGKLPAVNFVFLPPYAELPAASWGLPAGTKCYALRFFLQLNGQPALVCQMAVTAPRPPLLTSAGVVGLTAGRPDGRGPHLMIRLLAARGAIESGTPPSDSPVHPPNR